ncbi:Gfo/Idh/MocA family protein [Vibrio marisflavi]|uniref:Myo-inositol 2-dehydrogenase n=1 Tax=Vibrio marisflavi CECT 7928 TaxID=634439 RepID=A0ABM9A555_9VIBR|nr:Gfo/Idh/MocA family oxidoreductase [Vibrio marisflavi]CAH0540253.1 Myo-inositol 2-dehydrogenase [Vibrio marisflavi CECT 7928]
MSERKLKIGVLGCGPIAQAAHFESCTKAKNAELYAVCDIADELRERMAATHAAKKQYKVYGEMLADPELDAVIIATSDAFHVTASMEALHAGKHVLCEKPLGVSLEEGYALKEAMKKSGKIVQVAHMKRFDIGLQESRRFIRNKMGALTALKAWYCDSTHRYTVTDAVQPLIVTSSDAKKPVNDPKANLQSYYMLAHGSHLIDTARFLAGDIVSVRARYKDDAGLRCWFVETEFANGTLGHLDLTVSVRMDWHEGFQVYGENGSIIGKTQNPWYFKTSEVEIFDEETAATYRPLGADGHFYRRQVEAFADSILNGAPMLGATIDDGIESIKGMLAIAKSVETGEKVYLSDIVGEL